ncbi:MAG: DNA-processing protein DprA [Proteobacteria bacterium]|nr:DNA-processing protein DprA [Pseudomonadota bacterium]
MTDAEPRSPSELRSLSDKERLDWLRLARSENIGPFTFFELLGHFGSAHEALAAIPELARRGGRRRAIRICPAAEAERELALSHALGARLTALAEPDYPKPLAAIADPPPIVALRGQADLFAKDTLAIVGARNASAAGIRFAGRIAARLGAGGLVIASGLARGIDGAAHRGALETGTIAVVAGGADVAYPAENAELMDEIVARGALLSEMPLSTVPRARHFPRRNRLISGLAHGVLVIEAAPRSGSLITARLALEQGREVFAVPGSPLDPRCRGTNNLIRQGATLVEGPEDVLEELASSLRFSLAERGARRFEPGPSEPPHEAELAKARALLLERLGPSPVEVDELIRQSRLTPPVVATILLELELAGRLDRHPGNQVSLVETIA